MNSNLKSNSINPGSFKATGERETALLRVVVRAVLLLTASVNAVFLLSVLYHDNKIIQISSVGFGLLYALLYIGDVSGKIKVPSILALCILFANCCSVAFLFDLRPAPIVVFLPSFITSVIVLQERSSIRIAAVVHLISILVCYSRGDGSVELEFFPHLIFGSIIFVFFISSVIELISNRKHFFEMEKLKLLLERKRHAIKVETLNCKEQNKVLSSSKSELESKIEENKQRVDYLKTVSEELSQIASAAGKDIKAPLSQIGFHIEKLGGRLEELDLSEGLSDYLLFVTDGAGRMNAMVDDLLHYCDPSIKQVTQQVSTTEVLRLIESNLSNLMLRDNAQLIVQPGMPVIPGHKTEVIQLFQNLISNGIKFKQPGEQPKCEVGFTQTEQEVRFYVKDNGIGIPANRVKDVFGLFTRLHERGSYEGTGIGLALCRRIVLAAGGEIWAESDEGEGTTFFFTWPLVAKAERVPNTIEAMQV